MTLKHGHTLN